MAALDPSSVLLAEDDAELRESIVALLELVGWRVHAADSLASALEALDLHRVDLVLTDLFSGSPDHALDSIAPLLSAAAPTPVGVITAWTLPSEVVMRGGLRFVLKKPFNVEQLVAEIAGAMESAQPSHDDPRVRAVYAYFQALTARDWRLLDALICDDLVYELPGTTEYARRLTGRAAFLELSRQTFEAEFPDHRFDEVRAYQLPNGLAARYQARWSGPNGPMEQSGAVIFGFRGDRIATVGVRLDDRRLARAMAGAA